jgi:hypothetical protein
MKVSRRMFFGVAAGGLMVAGGGGALVVGPLPTGGAYKAFSDAEGVTLQAFSEALFPAAVLGVSVKEAELMARLDAYVDGFFGRERHLTRLMVRLMDLRARADGGAPLHQLDEARRVALLQRWESSGGVWAMGMQAIRALCAMAYFSHPRVQQSIGWGVGCDLSMTAAVSP